MKEINHSTDREEPNLDGDRAYLPSTKVRKDGFYCDEAEYRQEIQDLYNSYNEPDHEELSAFWHGRF